MIPSVIFYVTSPVCKTETGLSESAWNVWVPREYLRSTEMLRCGSMRGAGGNCTH